MRLILLISVISLLAGCCTTDTTIPNPETKYPEPPAALMQPGQQLGTIQPNE